MCAIIKPMEGIPYLKILGLKNRVGVARRLAAGVKKLQFHRSRKGSKDNDVE